MKLKKLFANITIKQANMITMLVIFIFSLMFVLLLIDEMYQDYEKALNQTIEQPYLSLDTEALEVQKKAKLKALFIKTILVITTLSFLLFSIAFGFYKILSSLLQRDTETFLKFFESAAHSEHVLIPESIFFKDYREMVMYVNYMLETINLQKHSLRELNVDLEKKVLQKTQALQELLQSQKEFLRYTVHETNTPLSVIVTSIELYNMQNEPNKQLSKIEVAVKNIFSIYDDLSYLVKKDQVEYKKVAINFENYLSSRIDFFDEVAKHSLIYFEYTPEISDVHIFFNETKLQRIVDNTITNAIKYTLPKESVFVKLYKSGSEVAFSMGSHSKAIQNPQKVFDAYYREEEGENAKDGFGLGLRLVRNICEEEDVQVSVDSDENYTVFTYKFRIMGT